MSVHWFILKFMALIFKKIMPHIYSCSAYMYSLGTTFYTCSLQDVIWNCYSAYSVIFRHLNFQRCNYIQFWKN